MVAPTPLQIELVLVVEILVEVGVEIDVPGQPPPLRYPHQPAIPTPPQPPIHQSWYEVTECTLSQANLDSDRNTNANTTSDTSGED